MKNQALIENETILNDPYLNEINTMLISIFQNMLSGNIIISKTGVIFKYDKFTMDTINYFQEEKRRRITQLIKKER